MGTVAQLGGPQGLPEGVSQDTLWTLDEVGRHPLG